MGAAEAAHRDCRIMAVGDSITEGGKTFVSYRPVLAAKLRTAGYAVEFVGSRSSDTAFGPLRHEGYGGKNVEFLAATVPAHFAATPAEVVLLHAGHNHTVEDHPVPGMVVATERLISGLRAVNPHVVVLLAQVIPSGKLPKYAYLPDLNVALAQLAVKLSTPSQPVILVDQATGFDWATDTIDDHVHPNAAGAEKIAARWFAVLTQLPGSPLARSTDSRP
jgi:lysophospholipase L1-like esterase